MGRWKSFFLHMEDIVVREGTQLVIDMFKDLWEIEGAICSYIYEMHQEHKNGSYKSTAYAIFFLEALHVPPTKFRPAAKASDSSSVVLLLLSSPTYKT
ncbi:Aspartate decarboxylase-like domain-containing protein [Artemisia annua]|uniref:Aspartate decarboxylase-like domain-containing protein n=1 Tax=Artemisia annua TaxID=35608 RepID=A0A2U1L187_ARTAN|nr:Aspartate decarboxylase-like domain-containing protein [Artemisia annua]